MNQKYRLLLVEDDAGDADYFFEVLSEISEISFEVEWVKRLAVGIDYLGREKVDIVILDLHLSDSRGLSTYDDIRKVAQDTPVVVLTGLDDSETALLALKRGAQDYMAKGDFDHRVLSRSIRYAIERQKLHNELQDALDHVKTLRGLLPICSNCHKIRDDQGYWERVESYISKRSDATFTHSICPDCVRALYPDYADILLEQD